MERKNREKDAERKRRNLGTGKGPAQGNGEPGGKRNSRLKKEKTGVSRGRKVGAFSYTEGGKGRRESDRPAKTSFAKEDRCNSSSETHTSGALSKRGISGRASHH